MAKILITNEGLSDNLGDQAILYVLRNIFINHEIDFIDFTRNYDSKKLKVKNKKIKKKKPLFLRYITKLNWLIIRAKRYLLASYKSYDLVVIGGGELIRNNLTFPYSLFLIALLIRSKKLIFGVGCEMKFSKRNKILFEYSLKRISKIILRDKRSAYNLKYSMNIHANISSDVVFLISDFHELKQQVKNERVSFAFQSYSAFLSNNQYISERQYISECVKLIETKAKLYKEVKLFHTTENDALFMLKLADAYNNVSPVKIKYVNINTLENLIEYIANSSLIISNRMHALIIALSYNCEIEVIRSSEKLIGFEKEIMHDSFNITKVKHEIYSTINEEIFPLLDN